MSTTPPESHIPSQTAQGLGGLTMCRRFSHFRTGDHRLTWNLVAENILGGTTEHYCPECLAEFRRTMIPKPADPADSLPSHVRKGTNHDQ